MRTMHLFAGAGGGLLGDLILGHTPVVAVEVDKNCCETLRRRRDDGWLPDLHVWEGDIRVFDPSEWKGKVDCVHAGFPCQDISAAGKGKGISGAKSGLFSEVGRVIEAIRPKFVFLENSPRIITRGLAHVLRTLAELGYDAVWTILSAEDCGAPHLRKRWWCLAANYHCTLELQPEMGINQVGGRTDNCIGEGNADPNSTRREDGSREQTYAWQEGNIRRSAAMEDDKNYAVGISPWFEVEPDVGVLVHGMADGVVSGAVKALGNGQVPICMAAAWCLLWDALKGGKR